MTPFWLPLQRQHFTSEKGSVAGFLPRGGCRQVLGCQRGCKGRGCGGGLHDDLRIPMVARERKGTTKCVKLDFLLVCI